MLEIISDFMRGLRIFLVHYETGRDKLDCGGPPLGNSLTLT